MLGALRTYLLTIAEVAALAGVKVHVTHAEQGTTGTHVVIERFGQDENNHLGGAGDLKTAEVEIHCKASTPEAAEALAGAIAEELEPHVGAMGTKTLEAAIHTDTRDWEEAAKPGSDVTQYVTTLEFTLQYR